MVLRSGARRCRISIMNRSLSRVFALVLLLYVVILLGCSASVRNQASDNSSQLELTVAEAPRIDMNADVERSSEALHNFLVGELAFEKENYDKAEASFKRASDLAAEPVPHVNLQLSELLLKNGDLERALFESQRAIDAERDNPYPWILRGGILEALGKFDEARDLYLALAKKGPNISAAPILYAAISAQKGEPEHGIPLLKEYLEHNPKDTNALTLIGAIYEVSGKTDLAVDAYQKAQKLNGEDVVSLDTIRALLRAGRADRVIKIREDLKKSKSPNLIITQSIRDLTTEKDSVQTALRRIEVFSSGEINLADVRFRLAIEQAQAQHFPEALRDLTILLAKEPKYELARYYRASMYAGTGRAKEAVQDLLQIEPNQELYIKSRTFAAFLLRQSGDLAKSERVVREALKSEPDNKHLFSYLILILRDENKLSEAAKMLEKSLRDDPTDEKNLFNYAVIQKEQGDEHGAIQTMEKIVTINPRNADALNYVAYSLAENGADLDRAQELISKALEVSPDDAFYLDTLGWIQFKKGDIAKAIELLKRAASMSGNDLVVLDHYGDALIKAEKMLS